MLSPTQNVTPTLTEIIAVRILITYHEKTLIVMRCINIQRHTKHYLVIFPLAATITLIVHGVLPCNCSVNIADVLPKNSVGVSHKY